LPGVGSRKGALIARHCEELYKAFGQKNVYATKQSPVLETLFTGDCFVTAEHNPSPGFRVTKLRSSQ
jgi:hypothetical protein